MGIPGSAPIRFEFTWRPLHQGGLDDLLIAVERNQYRFIVVDTLTRAIPGVDQNDQRIIGPIIDQFQRLALSHNMTITPADHTRKPNWMYADPIDDIMGSTAKAASADAVLAIYQEQGKRGAILKGRGKDIEDVDLALMFHKETCSWQSNGDAVEFALTARRKELLAAMPKLGGRVQAPAILKIVGGDRSNIYKELNDLANAGLIISETIEGKIYYGAK